MFRDKKELKNACQLLAAQENFEYVVVKSDQTRLMIKCMSNDCPWHLHAAKVSDAANGMFEIRTMSGEHNCLGVQHLGHRQASKTFLAEQIQAKLRDHPKYRPKEIQQDIHREFGITIPYHQANRAKAKALEAINGSDEEEYAALPKYCEDLGRNNPGSTFVLESTPNNDGRERFRRMFVCYAASAIGFEYCPPVLGLNGTHLKTKYKGVLLTATAVDANGSLFPVASAVVDVENDDNWLWLVQLFRGVLVQHVPTLLVP